MAKLTNWSNQGNKEYPLYLDCPSISICPSEFLDHSLPTPEPLCHGLTNHFDRVGYIRSLDENQQVNFISLLIKLAYSAGQDSIINQEYDEDNSEDGSC